MLLLVLLGRFPCARPEAAPGGVAGPGVPPPALALPGDLLHGPKDGILHDLSAGGLQLRLFGLTSRLFTLVQRPHQSKAHSFQEAGRLSPVDICARARGGSPPEVAARCHGVRFLRRGRGPVPRLGLQST